MYLICSFPLSRFFSLQICACRSGKVALMCLFFFFPQLFPTEVVVVDFHVFFSLRLCRAYDWLRARFIPVPSVKADSLSATRPLSPLDGARNLLMLRQSLERASQNHLRCGEGSGSAFPVTARGAGSGKSINFHSEDGCIQIPCVCLPVCGC
jgi:hypothetical protein